MTRNAGRTVRFARALAFVMLIPSTGDTVAHPCTVPSHHAGVPYPVDRIDPQWVCRLHPIITGYTTATKIGPVRLRLPATLYDYLLDHPPAAAALTNRLDLGLYKSEALAEGLYWGTDGEGTEGFVQLIYRDPHTRIYYLEGTHDGRFLPPVSGRAVALLRTQSVAEPGGAESVDTTVVSYLQLNNRVLAGLVSLLRPLIGEVVARQLRKAFEAATRLSRLMHREPDRVLSEATDPPALPDDTVAFLRTTLGALDQSAAPASRPPVVP